MSHANCPVCQEDLHTSREPCQIPPCHHLLHKSCFDRLLANSHFYCPICYGSLMDLSPIWKLYKKQIQNNPMPERYQVLHLIHLNTSYLTDSYIGFTLKMESVTKNTIFGLKMIVKSSLEKKIFLKLYS